MNDLYVNAADDVESSFVFDDNVLKSALKRIYERDFNPMTDIEENLFNEYWKQFNKATDAGFGIAAPGSRDFDFQTQLRTNNAIFAAFKTHRFQNDVAGHLLDEKGQLKPFRQWVKDTESIVSHHNEQWLKTEYDTTIIRAHHAADWRQFEREEDILPNLRWNRSTSIIPGEDHRIFWNRVWSMRDLHWSRHRPGDRWNCKCSLSATDEPVTDNSGLSVPLSYKPSPGLGGNPGITAKIFSDDHPYVANAYRGAQKAVKNYIANLEQLNQVAFKLAKEYKSGGKVFIHPMVDKSKTDYKAIHTIGNIFAKKGEVVKITPSVHYKSAEYNNIYGSLKDTIYERKCPDLKIGDNFYEFESFVPPFKKQCIRRMLSHGLKQSSHIIINNSKGANDRYIHRSIMGRVSQGVNIQEVWLYEKGKLRLFYKNTGAQ